MAARPTWKGVLKISLVTIPIKVFPATEQAPAIAFHQLHTECKTRVTQRRWCTSCAREVPNNEIVKGFEFSAGQWVILTDADFDKVSTPSMRVIDLVQFADLAALDPIAIDRSYYLRPTGTGGEAFATIHDAMKGKVGVGKLAIYGREYLVAVRPWKRALLLHTLHHAAEIRSLDLTDDEQQDAVLVAFSQVRLARQVIAALDSGPLDLAAYTDEYRAGLQALIDAKIAGQEIVVPAVETLPVSDLREALTQSLQAVTTKRPMKVTSPRRAARKAN